ncbi:RBM17 [Cordylochernes scorpioides]|uniref:Splicing factor 45 n=1 Tax=Cordylochernes scorpioides TaxID=51811 RepID=A0ABY6LCE7_9ARAC|nr:RBM17 [Cordylochernes scorpioides]UYV78097.1 RBM17 [Cordylochernes scorpioides]
MSLYDGLDIDIKDKTNKDVEWSTGIKLLQTQLQLKKTALAQAKRDQMRKSATLTPVLDLKSRRDDQDEMPPPPVVGFTHDSSGGATLLGGDWDIKEEYDPFWPSDYEKIQRERREKEKKLKSDDKKKVKVERRELQPRLVDDDYEEEEETKKKSTTGVAIAPPAFLTESSDRKDSQPYQSGPSGSVAARIMAKYGYKEGQGLGKQEQGMSQALLVEKTSKRGGKIIHEKDIAAQSGSPSHNSQQAQEKITEMMKNPSKVVLLKNMVGPGEVDEYLETETKEECGKYGEVISCLIFEIPSKEIPEEEAVRIFIEFKRVESAIKALIDLNGRYFGGRVVKASFYDQDKFNRLELNE